MGLVYGSVCSGIEAATVAWKKLGWKAAFFSEIAKFPCSVLAHHYPDVPNFGDMTKFKEWPDVAIDVLVGGTPCQSFSVAGLRQGMADPRGNLALVFLAIADRYRPRWVVWENVPGVFSSASHVSPDPRPPEDPVDLGRDGQEVETEDEYDSDEVHAFNCFVAGLSELGYGVSWSVLDAQYFGLAQRRERVFVVGHLGDWRRSAAVLLEPESMSGNPPPSRKAGKGVAPSVTGGPPFSRTGNERVEADALVAYALRAKANASHRADSDTYVQDSANPLGSHHRRDDVDHDTYIPEVSPALKSRDFKGPSSDGDGDGAPLIAHALTGEGHDASEDGSGRGTPIVPEAIPIQEVSARDSKNQNGVGIGLGAVGDPMYTLQAGHQHGVATQEPLPFDETQVTSKANRSNPEHGDPSHPLTAKGRSPAVAIPENDEVTAYRTNAAGQVMDQGDKAATVNTFTDKTAQFIAFSAKDSGADAGDVSPTLRAMGHDKSHANTGGKVAALVPDGQVEVSETLRNHPRAGSNTVGQVAIDSVISIRTDVTPKAGGDVSFTVTTPSPSGGGQPPAVAVQEGQSGCREYETAGALRANGPGHDPVGTRVRSGMRVRRLTPRETERLQGFPDDYTLIPTKQRKSITDDRFAYLRRTYPNLTREEAEKLARDGPRYMAIGNSMPVPVMLWIGEQIQFVEGIPMDGHERSKK